MTPRGSLTNTELAIVAEHAADIVEFAIGAVIWSKNQTVENLESISYAELDRRTYTTTVRAGVWDHVVDDIEQIIIDRTDFFLAGCREARNHPGY